jgi:hypothetical protein
MRTSLLLGSLAFVLAFVGVGCSGSHTAGDDDAGTGLLDAAGGDGSGPPIDAGPTADGAGHDAATTGDAASVPCTTPGTFETVACGTMCGTTERFCTSAHTWSYDACTGAGECEAGTSEMQPCGACGTRLARCGSDCTWDESGTCTGEGSCMPGERGRTDAGCAAGLSRALVCNAMCAFDPGPCEMVECSEGMTEDLPCGTRCGTQTRTCDVTGHWVDGACMGEGACEPGAMDTAPCGLCGTQTRSCGTTCAWAATSACTGEITCGPPPVDTCVDATTLRDYSTTTCVAGACSYPSVDVTCTCAASECVGVLIRGLGGPAGFGTGVLAPTDDGSSAAIPISGTFASGLNYYGTTYTSVFVNGNGNLSFGAAQGIYTSTFPAMSQPTIAPWWADVDTRSDGRPARNNIAWSLDATRLIVTWHLVGYYATHDDREDSFQLVLTDRSDVAPGDFDVELRYEQCAWTTGDASGGSGGLGGTPAAAGFNRGDGVESLALPGSGTAAVLDLCTASNAGTLGVWRYQVRGGMPM